MKKKLPLSMGERGAHLAGFLFLLPSLAGVSIFVLIPFLDVIKRSFSSAVTRQFVGMKNYESVLGSSAFQQAAGNTLRFVAVCMPILILLSLLLAIILYNQLDRAPLFKTTFLIPMAIPVASVVLLWQVLFHQNGFLTVLVEKFGLTGADWMNSGWSFWVLVGSYVWKNLGYDIVLWLAGLASIPNSLYEAAQVDGAGSVATFFRITLPNLLPSLYTITVLSFLNSFKVFREAYLVAGDYPNGNIYLIQHLFNNWFRDLSMDKLSAAAVLVAIVIFVLILLLRRAWETD